MGTVLNMTGKLIILLYQRWQIILMLCAKNYLFILFFSRVLLNCEKRYMEIEVHINDYDL